MTDAKMQPNIIFMAHLLYGCQGCNFEYLHCRLINSLFGLENGVKCLSLFPKAQYVVLKCHVCPQPKDV